MYQEEKLARDVYELLGDKWGLRPFLKIKKSEQRHMDAVGRLLDKYGISRPVGDLPENLLILLFNLFIMN